MPTYKYEVINLRRVPHGREDQFHWHSDAEGVIGGHECLGEFLNERGARGWKIASHVSDGHFGNTVVLQMEEGAPEQRVEVRVEREVPAAGQAVDVEALAKSLGDEFKSALQALPPVVVPQPPTASEIAQAVVIPTPVAAEEMVRVVEARILPALDVLRPNPKEIANNLAPLFSLLLTQLEEQNTRLQGLQELMTPAEAVPSLVEAKRTSPRWLPWKRGALSPSAISN